MIVPTFRVLLASSLLTLALAPPTAQAQPSPVAASGDAEAPARQVVDRVIAVVNDEVILNSELMLRVAPLAYDLNKIADLKERTRKQKKMIDRVLEEMINEELVRSAARESKLEVSAKEVQKAIEDLKRQNNLDDTQLAEALRMQGYSMSSYRRDVRNQILRMRAVNTLVRPKVNITEEEVRAKYDENARQAAQVSEVKLQHILVALPSRADEKQIAAAKEKASNILQRARSGEDFGKLAGELSDDPATKNTGGELGWVERGTIATEWELIVFAMSKGETRGPINGPRGFHIFHVADLKKNEQEPFEKVKEKIRNELYRVELDKETRQWVEELRKKSHYEILL